MAGAPQPVVAAIGRRVVRAYCRRALGKAVDLRIEGLEHVPRTGPALLAARHFHHLFDGCALVATLPRPVHIVVALDWARGRDRRLLEWGCATLRWPTVFRPDAPDHPPDPTEAARYLRRAAREATALLRAGELLVVFPEGFPNVDPNPTPKADDAAFLPFRPGFVRFAALAQRDRSTRVPIVPTGFAYERGPRWRATLRFGAPHYLDPGGDQAALVTEVVRRVRELSAA